MKHTTAQKLNRMLRRALPWVGFFLLLAGLAAVQGLDNAFVNDYEIMNGDWQNYNPVRRLLAGQCPYADFTVYLGAGELYSVAAVLLVIGNSFGHSMVATNALTWFFFELLIFAAAVVVLGPERSRTARAVTAAASALYLAAAHSLLPLPGVLANFLGQFLQLAAHNGNSARMIRAGSLPLAVLLIALALRQDRAPKPGAKGPGRFRPLCPADAAALAAGALVPWSNDMGAALYVAVSLAYGLLLLRRNKTSLKPTVVSVVRYILLSCAGLGAAVVLVSRGHPFAWLRQTRGTGGYQAWYYGSTAAEKVTDLSQIPTSPAFWLVLALAVGSAVLLFAAKTPGGALRAAGCFALCLAMVLWHVAYCVLSCSGNGPILGCNALLGALLPAGLALALTRLRQRFPAEPRPACRLPALLCAGFAAVVLCLGLTEQAQARRDGRGDEYTYVPSLGAWLGDQAGRLATEQGIAAGARVWGTYAGALETMTGQFQPSGTDYIIHVLGDGQRFRYLTQFQSGACDLVETPSYKVSEFERWSRNANWWFYRELYRYWEPLNTTYACGGMHILWHRTGVDNDQNVEVTVSVTQEAPGCVTLTLAAPEGYNGVADVTLDYSFAADFRLGGTGDFLLVQSLTEQELCASIDRPTWGVNYYIPTDKTSYDIPVTIQDGTGSVRLQSVPDTGRVTVRGATVNATFFDWEYYYE
ncbi:MAG: hypothetical protein ACI4OL_00135 [Gemmiger sp.]